MKKATKNTEDFVDAISRQFSLTPDIAKNIVNFLVKSIIIACKEGEVVRLNGFGTFRGRIRKGRMVPNPRDLSKQVKIESINLMKYTSSSQVKQIMSGRRQISMDNPYSLE